MDWIAAAVPILSAFITWYVTLKTLKKPKTTQYREELLDKVLAPIYLLIEEIEGIEPEKAKSKLAEIRSIIKSNFNITPKGLISRIEKLTNTVSSDNLSWEKEFLAFKLILIEEHARYKRILGYPGPEFKRRRMLVESPLELCALGFLGAFFVLIALSLLQLSIESPEEFVQYLEKMPTSIIASGMITALGFLLLCFVGIVVSVIRQIISFFKRR